MMASGRALIVTATADDRLPPKRTDVPREVCAGELHVVTVGCLPGEAAAPVRAAQHIAVYLTYADARGHAMIDRELYLPRCWSDDSERCGAAGVPVDAWRRSTQSMRPAS